MAFIKAQFSKHDESAALLAIAIYFLAQMAIGMGGLAVSHHPAWRTPTMDLLRSLTLTCALGTFFFSLRDVPLATAVTLYTLQDLQPAGGAELAYHPCHDRYSRRDDGGPA